MELGVCYYPEHWPQERWELDAKPMVQIGLTHIGMTPEWDAA